MLRKRMSTMLLTAGVLLLSAVSLPGCGNKAENSSAPPTPTTTATMPTLLNVEITGLLTTGQVGAALGRFPDHGGNQLEGMRTGYLRRDRPPV